jgi:hypothetical protein
MPAIVTNKFRMHNAKQFIEGFDEDAGFTSFANTAAGDTSLETNMYLFIGKVDPWTDDTSPPTPTDSVANTEYSHWRDMIAAKKIGSSDITHAVRRVDWANNTAYFAYNNANNALYDQNYYVLTDEYNVYKCLANNLSGGNSTTKPSGNSTAGLSTSDGYKWKFLYTISAASALKFATPSYIPTQTVRHANTVMPSSTQDNEKQRNVELACVDGRVEIINKTANGSGYHIFSSTLAANDNHNTSSFVLSTGSATDDIYNDCSIHFTDGAADGLGGKISDYNGTTKIATIETAIGATPANTAAFTIAPTVTITGDGQGLTARATGSNTTGVEGVTVLSAGNSYSNSIATITANASHGSGATATSIIPPKGDHGFDLVEELGGYFVMLNTRLEYSESNNFTTDNDFRKVGLLAQPNFANGDLATSTVLDQAVEATIQSLTGTAFAADDKITGVLSGATGRVVDYNGSTNKLKLIDVTKGTNSTAGFDTTPGSFQNNETFSAIDVDEASKSTAGNTNTVTGGDMQKFSGNIIYVENRSPVSRASDQIEDIKLIVEF